MGALMTEATQVNVAIRRHLGPLGRFVRLEGAIGQGWPDWHYVLRGASGWIEAKLIPPSGAPPAHLTREQVMWAHEEFMAGGRWTLVGLRLKGREREWLAYGPIAAWNWYEAQAPAEPDLRAAGAFPTRELVELLAPRRIS